MVELSRCGCSTDVTFSDRRARARARDSAQVADGTGKASADGVMSVMSRNI